MARKKEKHSLGEDLNIVRLPFKLYNGFAAVVEEMENKNFEYEGIYENANSAFVFRSKEKGEYITVSISDENLLIKQFSESQDEGKDKLKVIYVVKDSGRNFKIL